MTLSDQDIRKILIGDTDRKIFTEAEWQVKLKRERRNSDIVYGCVAVAVLLAVVSATYATYLMWVH